MMRPFEIVAHRGVPTDFPENTLQSFERAIDLGADAVELDVRLTADGVPVVFHYVYLREKTSLAGPIFNYTFDQLRRAHVLSQAGASGEHYRVSSLAEVLEALGGRIGLEIEIKGPEPEAPRVVAEVLHSFASLWPTIEITSYEPLLLREIRERCPGILTDLLFPRSEPWMGLDIVAHFALHRGRLAGARAVHLHPTQLTPAVIATLRQHQLDVHAWDVNDEFSLHICTQLDVNQICTDRLRDALNFRAALRQQ